MFNDFGFRVESCGFRALDQDRGAGCKVRGAGCRVQGAGCRVQGAGYRAQGAGCRVQEGEGVKPSVGSVTREMSMKALSSRRRTPAADNSTPARGTPFIKRVQGSESRVEGSWFGVEENATTVRI